MESARVVMLNDRSGCVLTARSQDAFVLVIVQSGKVQVDDCLEGSFETEGRAEFLNMTNHEKVAGEVVEIDASRVRALDWVRSVNSPQRVRYAKGHP